MSDWRDLVRQGKFAEAEELMPAETARMLNVKRLRKKIADLEKDLAEKMDENDAD